MLSEREKSSVKSDRSTSCSNFRGDLRTLEEEHGKFEKGTDREKVGSLETRIYGEDSFHPSMVIHPFHL